jgi:hypothetical protein
MKPVVTPETGVCIGYDDLCNVPMHTYPSQAVTGPQIYPKCLEGALAPTHIHMMGRRAYLFERHATNALLVACMACWP